MGSLFNMEYHRRLLLLFLFDCCCTKACGAFSDGVPLTRLVPEAGEKPYDSDVTLNEKIRNALLISKMTLAQERARQPPEIDIPENRLTVDALYVARKFNEDSPRSDELWQLQLIFEEVTKVLQKKYNIDPSQVPSKEYLMETAMAEIVEDCIKSLTVTNCNKDKYRTFDGSCNNLRNPTWGMSSSCFERLLPPVYSDGIHELRKAKSGKDLPNPRKLSVALHNDVQNPDPEMSLLSPYFGQFITHDMSASPWPIKRNITVNCCANPAEKEEECVPVTVDTKDPFYSAYDVTCLNVLRTTSCPTCGLGAREQMVQPTSFIDGSNIYGLTVEDNNKIRNLDGSGTLKSNFFDGSDELLPPSQDKNKDACSFQRYDSSKSCFGGGDSRINQHPPLMALHTIFLKQHNRLARLFKSMYPCWKEEKLFQEARRIVIAQLQMITYSEFLPQILGSLRNHNLFVLSTLSYTQYDPTINPTMVSEFSTAAFRYGHSMVGDKRNENIKDFFNYPFDFYERAGFDDVTTSLLEYAAQKFDRYVSGDVTNHLYKIRGQAYGLDLVMMDIFRGRDHGLSSYVEMVKYCGGPDITSFSQLEQRFRKENIELFEKQYESVEDIDLFSGGLAEEPTGGAVVGPTFVCILEHQFFRTKFGDRFYFEHGQQTGSFTIAQLREIKKTTFAKIICDNTRIDILQQNVLYRHAVWNINRTCNELPDLDLRAWSN